MTSQQKTQPGMSEPKQLVFDLPHLDAYEAEDFLVSACNQSAANMIGQAPDSINKLSVLLALASRENDNSTRHAKEAYELAKRLGGKRGISQAAGFHSEKHLLKGDLASEYDNDIRIWVEELLEIGDLGRNPRNLRRVLHELRSVLEGAVP